MKIATLLPKFILLASVFTSPVVLSEKKICSPSPCIDMEKHFDYSRENSTATIAGSFVIEGKQNIIELDSPTGKDLYVEVLFRPSSVMKGDGFSKPIKFKLPIEKLVLQSVNLDSKTEEDLLTTWVNSINSKISGKNALEKYEALESSISQKLINNGKSSVDMIVVKVAFGDLDSTVRKASVPVFEGQEYIVYLFREVTGDGQFLFPWDFNIYSHDAYEIINGS